MSLNSADHWTYRRFQSSLFEIWAFHLLLTMLDSNIYTHWSPIDFPVAPPWCPQWWWWSPRLYPRRNRLFSIEGRDIDLYISFCGFSMFVFGHPFVITIEEDLSRTDGFALKFDKSIFQQKGRFGFEQKLGLFNKWLHFKELISSKTTHFRQCRLYVCTRMR